MTLDLTGQNSAPPPAPPRPIVKWLEVDAVTVFPDEIEIVPLPPKTTPASGGEKSPCEYLALFAATRTRTEMIQEAGGGKNLYHEETIGSLDGVILVGATVILVETIVTLVGTTVILVDLR